MSDCDIETLCNLCKQIFCLDYRGGVCIVCQIELCNKCETKCDICRETICLNCQKTCSLCARHTCNHKYCMKECLDCNLLICNTDCMKFCRYCDVGVCFNCYKNHDLKRCLGFNALS